MHELVAAEGELTVVESVGGVRSPLASDGDTIDLADSMRPAFVLLVADAGLGTINSVRLSVDALAPHRVVVYLNRFDPADEVHTRNAEWLRTSEGFQVLVDLDSLVAAVTTRLR